MTGLCPGYQQQIRSLTSRTRIKAALELLAGDDGVRAELCGRRLERALEIDAEAASVKRQIAALVAASGTTLTQMHGVGPLVAARLLAEVVDVLAIARVSRVADHPARDCSSSFPASAPSTSLSFSPR